MNDFIWSVCFLLIVGSCTVQEICKKDSQVGQYKFCSYIFEKEIVLKETTIKKGDKKTKLKTSLRIE